MVRDRDMTTSPTATHVDRDRVPIPKRVAELLPDPSAISETAFRRYPGATREMQTVNGTECIITLFSFNKISIRRIVFKKIKQAVTVLPLDANCLRVCANSAKDNYLLG